ncbi:exonuclease GOR-like [Homarus americanus]|uniref:RNA exonuclease 1-like 2 n=1 Tax=Homarus americanus TaxID=6706 RepID=A0A8J5NDU0_HOMAM|nr:exonuclease GOR-like [Homarus americanus]KAG7177429.1 RNA exonuclease 1-like 2 [Homarus americanus]
MALYHRLQHLKLSEEDMCFFGFPLSHWQIGKARLPNPENEYSIITRPDRRICRRCKTAYRVDHFGRSVSPELCGYHWGKLSTKSVPFYYCCRGPVSSEPCCIAPQHVSDEIDPKKLDGFIKTNLNSNFNKESVYALDCEMVFTTGGMDVAAITVVDSNCQVVYETLVLPDAPILDYTTQHSGLIEQQFLGVTTRLRDVHMQLLTLVGKNTILVGHGLNHDLLRLKVVHDHVVDTSVLYPHPRGLPFRSSLIFLKNRYLGRGPKIDTVLKCRGDAQATMQLARLKCFT